MTFVLNFTPQGHDNTFDINARAVCIITMRAIGQGYSGLETFMPLMNLPKPGTANKYDKIINKLAVPDITMMHYKMHVKS